jgi:hypothetical protein
LCGADYAQYIQGSNYKSLKVGIIQDTGSLLLNDPHPRFEEAISTKDTDQYFPYISL